MERHSCARSVFCNALEQDLAAVSTSCKAKTQTKGEILGFRKAEPHPCSINASHAAPRVSFSNFYCSPPFPPLSVANPKNGTIPVLHVSLPALGCPHQQPVGDGMKQPPSPGGLTTILPLSRLCQQLQPTAVVLRVTSKRGALPPFPEFSLQALKAAGSS